MHAAQGPSAAPRHSMFKNRTNGDGGRRACRVCYRTLEARSIPWCHGLSMTRLGILIESKSRSVSLLVLSPRSPSSSRRLPWPSAALLAPTEPTPAFARAWACRSGVRLGVPSDEAGTGVDDERGRGRGRRWGSGKGHKRRGPASVFETIRSCSGASSPPGRWRTLRAARIPRRREPRHTCRSYAIHPADRGGGEREGNDTFAAP